MNPEETFWSPAIRGLVPYVPGEQPQIPNLIKLNTNENPYPPSPLVVQAIAAAARQGLQLYPDPRATALREAVAAYHGIHAGQVFAGNGSDEVLAHAFFAFFRHGRPLLMPDVTYSFYQVYCGLYGIAFEVVPLDAQMQIRVADYARADPLAVGGVVIANPNAPTGCALPLAAIEQLLHSQPRRVVLVDEAYVDFGGDSAVPLIERYPNLLVVHTLSKSRSLASLRVGFAVGQRHLIEALERVKDSFNSYPLDRLAQVAAIAAYEDDAWFRDCCAKVIASRERLAAELTALGFEVVPSAANLLFARHPGYDAATLALLLREKEIFVRHFNAPRIDQHLRISIGTDAECDILLDALCGIFSAYAGS